MEAYQWFLLGMMVALTPCLIILSVLVCRAGSEPGHDDKDTAPFNIKVLPFASRPDYKGQAMEAGQHSRTSGKLGSRVAGDANPVVLVRTKANRPHEQ
jgi:hypothetical protein